MPAPLSPAPRGQVEGESVTLKVANAVGTDLEKAKYVFEITSSTGQKETSTAQNAGDKATSWAPKMKLKGGEKYTWTVRVEDDKPIVLIALPAGGHVRPRWGTA